MTACCTLGSISFKAAKPPFNCTPAPDTGPSNLGRDSNKDTTTCGRDDGVDDDEDDKEVEDNPVRVGETRACAVESPAIPDPMMATRRMNGFDDCSITDDAGFCQAGGVSVMDRA